MSFPPFNCHKKYPSVGVNAYVKNLIHQIWQQRKIWMKSWTYFELTTKVISMICLKGGGGEVWYLAKHCHFGMTVLWFSHINVRRWFQNYYFWKWCRCYNLLIGKKIRQYIYFCLCNHLWCHEFIIKIHFDILQLDMGKMQNV